MQCSPSRSTGSRTRDMSSVPSRMRSSCSSSERGTSSSGSRANRSRQVRAHLSGVAPVTNPIRKCPYAALTPGSGGLRPARVPAPDRGEDHGPDQGAPDAAELNVEAVTGDEAGQQTADERTDQTSHD